MEKAIKNKVKLSKQFQQLLTVPGIGLILAMTIMLEVGDIGRFPQVGNFASYSRCVSSQRLFDGKSKGHGNRKNGNRYLSWAFTAAAQKKDDERLAGSRPRVADVVDVRQLVLSPQRFRTKFGGLFLFLTFL